MPETGRRDARDGNPVDPHLELRAQLEQRLQECIRLTESGVRVVDPATTYVAVGVRIGAGSVIYPNTTISGETVVGRDCRIGPNAIVADSTIGNGCEVFASVVEGAWLGDGVDVGPFSHLRPGAHLESGVHIGNFVEVKASRLGEGTKVGHFSYIGDAEVGRDVNIGAGTVTCNYDGRTKSKSVIADGAFIGSDTMLVAPVRIGRNAVTGAGSVVNRDVPDASRVAGVPARSVLRERGAGPGTAGPAPVRRAGSGRKPGRERG
jgi:bifunctional UDP-N-acetylglucosamine pyrophosphorylase/glucosamine-1-phosphate N-acetyltransferase